MTENVESQFWTFVTRWSALRLLFSSRALPRAPPSPISESQKFKSDFQHFRSFSVINCDFSSAWNQIDFSCHVEFGLLDRKIWNKAGNVRASFWGCPLCVGSYIGTEGHGQGVKLCNNGSRPSTDNRITYRGYRATVTWLTGFVQ
jgi:hypothetical protein